MEFDFEYYDKVLSYINQSTTYVDESLQTLINKVIEGRKKTFLPVNIFSDKVPIVQVGGSLNIIPKNNEWFFTTTPRIILKNNNIKSNDIEYVVNSLILKDNIEKYIKFLSQDFILQEADEANFILTYSKNLLNDDVNFSKQEIPHIKWFESNFYTKKDKKVNFKITKTNNYSFDKIRKNSDVFNVEELDSIIKVNKKNRAVNVSVNNQIKTNLFSLNKTVLEVSKEVQVLLQNIDALRIKNNDSIVTNRGIDNSVIKKDFHNLKELKIKTVEKKDSLVEKNILNSLMLDSHLFYSDKIQVSSDCEYINANNIIEAKFNGHQNAPTSISQLNRLLLEYLNNNAPGYLLDNNKYKVLQYKKKQMRKKEKRESIPKWVIKSTISNNWFMSDIDVAHKVSNQETIHSFEYDYIEVI